MQGFYTYRFSVTNSAGLSSSATRVVRVSDVASLTLTRSVSSPALSLQQAEADAAEMRTAGSNRSVALAASVAASVVALSPEAYACRAEDVEVVGVNVTSSGNSSAPPYTLVSAPRCRVTCPGVIFFVAFVAFVHASAHVGSSSMSVLFTSSYHDLQVVQVKLTMYITPPIIPDDSPQQQQQSRRRRLNALDGLATDTTLSQLLGSIAISPPKAPSPSAALAAPQGTGSSRAAADRAQQLGSLLTATVAALSSGQPQRPGSPAAAAQVLTPTVSQQAMEASVVLSQIKSTVSAAEGATVSCTSRTFITLRAKTPSNPQPLQQFRGTKVR